MTTGPATHSPFPSPGPGEIRASLKGSQKYPPGPWALCTPPDQHYPSVTAQHLLRLQEHLLGSRPCALCHTNVLPSIPSKSQGATGIAGHFMEENTSERSSNLPKVTQLVRDRTEILTSLFLMLVLTFYSRRQDTIWGPKGQHGNPGSA